MTSQTTDGTEIIILCRYINLFMRILTPYERFCVTWLRTHLCTNLNKIGKIGENAITVLLIW